MGVDHWSDYLVGFFLGSNLPYSVVKEHCCKVRQLKGGLQVHMDNSMFFFKLLRPKKHLRVLSVDPTIIRGKSYFMLKH